MKRVFICSLARLLVVTRHAFCIQQTSKQANQLTSPRGGYIFLLSVLVVGVISSAIVVSLVLIGIGAQRSGFSYQQSASALGLAHACAERALLTLRENIDYGGGEVISFSQGECEILLIGGSGNENRTLCTEGIVGNTVRRIEIIINRLLPETRIYSWQEVDIFTFCEYP